MHLTVEVALFLAVEDYQIESIFKGLQRSGDSFVRVHNLMKLASAGIHAPFAQAFFDLSLGENANQPAFFLAILKGLNLLEHDPSDDLAQRGRLVLAVFIRWPRKLPVRHNG